MARIDLGLPSYDSLFSTEKERNSQDTEIIQDLNVGDIKEFKNHPFHVSLDEDMVKLIESIEANGQLMPVLVRPSNDGYEMISGHRRKFAMEKLGLKKIKAVVKNLDDDQATILMIDSNVQREHILPTEKGFAYRMRLEAMNHQGKALLENSASSQVGTKYTKQRSDALLAEIVGESRNQIQRYIRLTHLIEPFQRMVDGLYETGMKIALNPAVEISFLKKEEQYDLLNCIEEYMATPSLMQAQKFKNASKLGTLNIDYMRGVLSVEKPNQVEKDYVKWSKYDKYFPKNYTQDQKDKIVDQLLSSWSKRREKGQER